VALDARTVAVVRAHRHRQAEERQTCPPKASGVEFEFTNPDGTPLHPATVTATFEQLAYRAGLSPIRLHDLRHARPRSCSSPGTT
jgi:hypothetical protein